MADSVFAPVAQPRELDADTESEAHASTIRRDGFVVLADVLSAAEVAAMRAALAPYLQGQRMGRNDFEGFRSERVYALLAKDPALALLVEHPRLLAIVDRLLAPTYLLSAFLAINVHGGETPQGWHFDDGGCMVPRPRPMYGVSAIWALDEFTAENGATQVIPRSHLWGRKRTVTGCRGCRIDLHVRRIGPRSRRHLGASRRRERWPGPTPRGHAAVLSAVAPSDREPGARGAPQLARNLPPRVQELLGYSIAEPSFMGYVDGLHPKRLVDPDYARKRRT